MGMELLGTVVRCYRDCTIPQITTVFNLNEQQLENTFKHRFLVSVLTYVIEVPYTDT